MAQDDKLLRVLKGQPEICPYSTPRLGHGYCNQSRHQVNGRLGVEMDPEMKRIPTSFEIEKDQKILRRNQKSNQLLRRNQKNSRQRIIAPISRCPPNQGKTTERRLAASSGFVGDGSHSSRSTLRVNRHSDALLGRHP